MLASVQTRKISDSTTAVTVIILDAIGVFALLQLNMVPIILATPLFLIPVSIYTTALGISKRRHGIKYDYGYHFAWSAIMLAIGAGWILLYEKMGVVISIIAVLAVVLGYVYLNKIKSA